MDDIDQDDLENQIWADQVAQSEQEEREFVTLCADLEKRCGEAKIPFQLVQDEEMYTSSVAVLGMHNGREHRRVTITSLDELKNLMVVPFEKYTFLADYQALCSYKEGQIEAAVRSVTNASSENILFRLADGQRRSEGEAVSIERDSAENKSGVGLSLGPISDDLRSLIIDEQPQRALSLKLWGVPFAGREHSYNDAVDYLERIANAIFIDIDITRSLALNLVKAPKPLELHISSAKKPKPAPIRFPRHQYAEAPVSLYWYAISATRMPLVQYLAYYQMIEYYFPIYSKIEAHNRIRTILKHPGFNTERDEDIAQLLTAASSGGRGFADEQSQLKATLHECLDPAGLERFLLEDDMRKQFLLSKSNPLKVAGLQLTGSDKDHRDDVANRIYSIRCKIVHTKSVGEAADEEGFFGLLLPFTPEAESLHFDIQLIRYVAQQIMIAAGRSLKPLGG